MEVNLIEICKSMKREEDILGQVTRGVFILVHVSFTELNFRSRPLFLSLRHFQVLKKNS